MAKKKSVSAGSASAGVSEMDTAAVIDSLLAVITDAVVKGDFVRFTGFGTVESRKGHSHAAGAAIDIRASAAFDFQSRQGI